MHYLEIGGAETSLIGLLHALDPEKVDIDLFLNEHRGELLQYVPSHVNVLPEIGAYSVIEKPIAEVIQKFQFGVVLGRIKAKIKYLLNRKKKKLDSSAIYGYIGKSVTPFLPSLRKYGVYDLAISYLTPHNIVLEKVAAKKKVCWIHTDYSSISVDSEFELPIWDKFDKIISISSDVSSTFASVFPSLQGKLVEIENFLPVQMIKSKSLAFEAEEMKRKSDEIIILTIGRYSYAKNLESIPELTAKIIDKGLNIRWFIIGYGNTNIEALIRERIKAMGLDDKVILLGKKGNPYPYIRACDWYIQPSRFEGKSIAVREAQLLGKPVIITNYPTAHSQIEESVDGFIGSLDIHTFAIDILRIMSDSTTVSKVIDFISGKEEQKEHNSVVELWE